MTTIVRRIGAGAGPTGQNLAIIPFNQRTDFNAANMQPDTSLWFAEAVFSFHLGSWDVTDHKYSIDPESRMLYLKPFGDPQFYPGGGDHHIHAKVVGRDGQPLFGAGVVFTSDGVGCLQPPTDPERVVQRTTEAPHGWCNLPIYAGSWPPEIPGPWAVAKQGWSDIVYRIGMPEGEHDSVCVVFREVKWSDIQAPPDPDPIPSDPLILVTLARIEARLNALAEHLGA
jgi:hypothetical protein